MVGQIHAAQKVRDEAMMSRIKLANEERDAALTHSRALMEKLSLSPQGTSTASCSAVEASELVSSVYANLFIWVLGQSQNFIDKFLFLVFIVVVLWDMSGLTCEFLRYKLRFGPFLHLRCERRFEIESCFGMLPRRHLDPTSIESVSTFLCSELELVHCAHSFFIFTLLTYLSMCNIIA